MRLQENEGVFFKTNRSIGCVTYNGIKLIIL